jgi:hypothetical protein
MQQGDGTIEVRRRRGSARRLEVHRPQVLALVLASPMLLGQEGSRRNHGKTEGADTHTEATI